MSEKIPFDAPFFLSCFIDRLHLACPGTASDRVPVVLLHLADGAVLDVCHVTAVTPAFLAVAVFREGRSCDKMDTVLLPYELIARIVISPRETRERELGFRLDQSEAALASGEARPACCKPE